ncbi:MAG TPA: sugar transferase [Gemmatimonadales bacterium]|nr:sugar transferase [Gemmatimonadales bacterium]
MGTALSAGPKRGFDIVAALAGLVATTPMLLAGALAVWLTSRGPVFYRARRAGLNGRPFDMLKLRTMRVETPVADRQVTAPEDDRVTPIGRVLRRWKIDELPQLWHVLTGEMSVVGPRPESWDIVQQHYTEEQRRVLRVRPGLVSPADVWWYPDLSYHDPPMPGVSLQEHYLRHHLPAKLSVELRYVERPGFLVDLRTIGQTIFCLLVRTWRLPARRRVAPLGPGDLS